MKQLDIFDAIKNPQDIQPDLIAVINKLMPSIFMNDVASIFACMNIAEEEIKIMQDHYPDKSDLIFDSFIICSPGKLFSQQYLNNTKLYRMHVKEILLRVATGKDTRLPTKVEKMIVLCELSLKQPLTNNATCLYLKLMNETFGYVPFDKSIKEMNFQEDYQGAMDELDEELIKKLTNPDRIHESLDKRRKKK